MNAARDVLVATDFSPSADEALCIGRALARRRNASLHLLHVCPLPVLRMPVSEAANLLNAARRALASCDPGPETQQTRSLVKVSEDPAKAIVAYARAAHIDVIVLGARGTRPLSNGVVGRVAERVLDTAPCAVLCVREVVAQPTRSANARAA